MVKRSREDFDLTQTDASPSASSQSSSDLLSELEPSFYETTKIVHIDTESGEAGQVKEVMRCSLPPHRQMLSFTSFEEYEVHYKKFHLNRCSECRKNFPTSHFLDLHISENHNPLADVLKDRGERTYSCFVEDCDRKCSTPSKRRMHLIDKHMFPKDYDFYVVNDGIDQRNSMLRSGRPRTRSSAAQHKADIDERGKRRSSTLGNIEDEPAEQNMGQEDDRKRIAQDTGIPGPEIVSTDKDMEGLVGAFSSLKFVPPSVRFGRGRGKGGFSRT